MRRLQQCFLVFFICGLFSLSVSAKDNELYLRKNLASAGGFIKFPFVIDKDNRLSLVMEAAPQFGYFIIDRLEISASIFTTVTIAVTDEQTQWKPVEWGFMVQGKYYFELGSNIYFFVGGGLESRFVGNNFGNTQISALIPVGFLIPFNRRVALSVGTLIKVAFSAQSGFKYFEVSPGYLGMQYFF